MFRCNRSRGKGNSKAGKGNTKNNTSMNMNMNMNDDGVQIPTDVNSQSPALVEKTKHVDILGDATCHTTRISMLSSGGATTTSATSTTSTNVSINFAAESASTPPARLSRTSSVMHEAVLTSGDKFYDDGYNDNELNTDVPRTLLKVNGARNAHSSDAQCREKELAILQQVFDRMMRKGSEDDASASKTLTKTSTPTSAAAHPVAIDSTSHTTSSFIPAAFLWGGSGTGKSHLIDAFCNRLSNDQLSKGVNVHIIKGKFEQHQTNDPYSAITQAFSDWCTALAASASVAESDRRNGTPGDQQGVSRENGAANRAAANLQRLRARVKASHMTSDQEQLLQSFVPSFSVLFNEGVGSVLSRSESQLLSLSRRRSQSDSRPSRVSDNDTAWNTLQYAFIQFLTIISSKECPLVLVLDDLQWASQDSMNLISTIVHRPHVLWLGTVRQEHNPHSSDEMLDPDDDLPFMKLLGEMRQRQPQEPSAAAMRSGDMTTDVPLPYTNIQLSNFTRQELHDWVARLFCQSGDVNASQDMTSHAIDIDHDEHTNALINKVVDYLFRHTKGNIFHAVQLLQDMECNNVLTYSRISFQWELNGDLNAGNDANRNSLSGDSRGILHLVTSKLRALPTQLQRMLAIAAYIRASFDPSLLQAVLEYEKKHNCNHEEILENDDVSSSINAGMDQPELPLYDLLEQAVLEGLLHNSIGATTYRFAHDRIQQAAHDLVPYGETRIKLRLRIGKCLWDLCTGMASSMVGSDSSAHDEVHTSIANDTGLMFIATEHLNCVPGKDHLWTVQRNLQTGEHALQMAALVPAATYLQVAATALRKLKADPWQNFYDLTLRLLRGRCDVELLLGNFDQGYSIGDEVLKHATSLADQLPTYAAMAKALAKQGEHQKAFEMSRRCAQLCNVYPKRGILPRGLRQLMSLRSYFRRTSDEDFLQNTPIIADAQTLLSMNLLRQLAARSFLCHDVAAWLLSVTRLLDMTRRVGMCGESAYALVIFAMIHNKLTEYKNACRYVELAKAVIRKVGETNRQAGVVHYMAVSFIDSYSKSPTEISSTFQYAYSSAMSKGEFEVGIMAHYGCTFHAFNQGHPLPGLLPAIDLVFEQMRMYKMMAHVQTVTEYTSVARYLAGELPLDWEERMDWSKYEQAIFRFKLAAFWNRMYLATYFGKYEFAESLYDRMMVDKLDAPDFTSHTPIVLFIGLMASNRYWQTKQQKFVKILRHRKRELKKICNTQSKSVMSRYLLLRAEWASIKSSDSMPTYIRHCYDKSIDAAERAGQLNEAGLACELAGEHVLRSTIDIQGMARPYFTKAMEYYQAWGAVAKCADLRSKRGEYIDEDQVRRSRKNNAIGGKAFEFANQKKKKIDFDLVSVNTPAAHTMVKTFMRQTSAMDHMSVATWVISVNFLCSCRAWTGSVVRFRSALF